MAVTRIKNNQITDASGSNTQLGVNAAVKLQNYSVTAGKLANSLVYGSDLTVSGNLTVNGTTTTVDTINTLIKDPILTLADGQTAGTPTVDIGLLGLRGSSNSSFMGWQESGNTFMAILSNTTASNTTVNVTSYANFTASTITAQGNLSIVGNIVGNANFSGNLSAGNILTPGIMSSAGNLTSGNILSAGLISTTGNATHGNILTAGLVSATGNITGGNLSGTNITGTLATASQPNITSVGTLTSLNSGTISSSGNVTGANILTGGLVSATGNVNGGNLISAALVQGVTVSATGNVIGGNISTAGLVTATGNVTGANILTGGLVSATGNITTAAAVNTANISLSGNVISALNVTGNIAGANITTVGLISATGTATAGNLLTGGQVSATGNATAGNMLTAGLISAAGNITSATNVNTPNVVSSTGLTLVTGSNGNINLDPNGTGNIVVASTYINGVLDPVQNQDVATKAYVDNIATTAIAYHSPVTAATISNLATATGGTITYTQPNGAGNGVGALLTTTGSFNLIDTANVQTVGTRILVKNEGNAVFNGVYTWANATNIVRSIDADTYGPDSTTDLSINDYFFTTSGNVNAGTAFIVNAPSGVITFGTSNITFATFSTSQSYTANNSAGISLIGTVFNTKVDNNTTAFDGGGNISVKPGANLTTPNIGAATGTSLSLTGAVNAGGNITGANILTSGLISATGNLTSGNILSAGLISTTGNATHGNILTGGIISAAGNINAPRVQNGGTGITIDSGFPGFVQFFNGSGSTVLIGDSGNISAVGNITGANILTGGLISSAGNINTSANINQTGTGNINGYNGYFSNTVTVLGNLNITGNVVAVQAGVFYGNSVTGNGAIYAGLPTYTPLGSNVVAQFSGNANSYSQVNFQNISNGTSASTDYIATANNGTDSTYYLDMGINGNTFNDPVNYPGFGPNDSYVHNHGGNLILNPETSGKAINMMIGGTANANIVAVVSSTGIAVTGLVSATGNITGPNVIGTTSGTFGNIVISGDNITDTNGRVNFNIAGGDVDFAVNGDTLANVFYVDAGTGSASFGSATQTTNAIVAFNTNTSILLPTGNTSARPGTGVTGMLRFNTTNNGLEIYDNAQWTPVGTTTFTLIADEQFNGDGSTVAFTLGSTQTTNSCIVSINGVVQIPTSAYSVSTTTLTFTEAPAAGDLIDVRELTTTTTVTSISNNSGNATVTGNATAAQVDVLGNLLPSGNAVYTLGSSTNYWKSLYVGGNTIFLGGLQLKSATGNVFNVFTSDGTTPATLGNLSVGTGNISVGNINNSNANGTGNIGNSSTYFNTIFAKATSAQYADLAEKYVADAEYAPGTVVSFGGEKEVTKSEVDADRAVAGVVSTNPSYIMNATLEAEHVAVVAFTGRVPTSVTGSVSKGDLMVSNGDGTARAEADPKAGSIIGKALENFSGETGTIEVVIGRF